VHAHDQGAQISNQLGKGFTQRFAPSHQHIVVGGQKVTRACCHSGAQATFYTVSFGGIARLLGDGKPDSWFRHGRGNSLQPKRRAPGAIAPGSPLKLGALGQPTQCVRLGRHGRHPARQALGRELLATVATALIDDRTTILGGHTGTETVTAGTHELGRLISTFHDIKPRWARFL
jgi:hypothetical protein